MRLVVDERLISRLQLAGTVFAASVLVLGLGYFFIRQITEEYEVNIRSLEAQQIREGEEMLVRQVETAKGFLANLRVRAESVLKARIREQVDEAHALAEAIYEQERGRRPESEIKVLIAEALRPLRFFGGKGYFFIDGMDGTCVLLPIGRKLEGTSLMNNRDDTGHYIMRGLIEAAGRPVGDGFSRYRWYAPGNSREMADKIAYVRHFKPFDWLIGTGQYVSDEEAGLKDEALARLRSFRFGKDGSGYIAVLANEGRILVAPSQPWSEGLPITELNPDNQAVARTILSKAEKGDGFVSYDWARVGDDGPQATKLTYVSRKEDWGWTLAAGLFTDDVAAATAERRGALARSIQDKIQLTVTALAVGVAASVAIGVWFSVLTRRLVGRYKADLTRQNDELRKTARDLFLINTMVENSAEMVFLADGDWTLIYTNPFAQEQLGWTADQLVGRILSDIIAEIAPRPTEPNCAASCFESSLLTRDGRSIPVEIVSKDVGHEGVLYHFVIARDITERCRWETDLRSKTAALEHSNAELEQFAYVASHDLREPLRMVSSYLSLLRRRYGDVLDKDGHDFLEFAREGAQRLDQLVLDLLEFSRIDRRGSPMLPMNVGNAVELAIRNLSLAIDECGAMVRVDDSVGRASILGDSGQIARLFQNLIGNAIKYRAEGRVPEVSVDCRRIDEHYEFSVSDNGIGIEPQYFERIFGIFQRLHTRQDYDGTGIGLAICRKIAERHGGTITVESEPGQGSSFRFRVPAALET
ncbi:hypothetical protein CU669_18555 [Paramagnetospirillum kuznetsovii]|uniref:histidine kinase n=1 Tax=Paramagnetospirillum kuznetsovii TaxID=2053833 RepID=A0A364NTS2_9PROT|nr:cache domain-containing protein [Paramagnetospirillum kuznetsovii]RAU20452.1 hypothetical protein CU669_18555 [Paramagnetospirillum kuznetsovii]